MHPTPTLRRRRARHLVSVLLVVILALGGGFALALAGAQSAQAAPDDVFFTTPEYTVMSHSPFQLAGQASPGDAITIESAGGNGPDCHAVADGLGIWQCNMTFTTNDDVDILTVYRDVDDGNPATQESDGQEHYISLPLTISETSPGNVLSNASPPTLTGTGAFPGADIVGTIGPQPCSGVADGLGNWACASIAQADGIYPSGVQQDVVGGGAGLSDVANTLYTSDIIGPAWPEATFPYDTTLGPASTQTSVRNPVIGGGPGAAEPFTTVSVAVENRGNVPIVHPGATPAIAFYCSSPVAADGSWSCSGATLTIGNFHEVSLTGLDQAGNLSLGSPDDDFDIEILPPPAPPVIALPAPGAHELPPFEANGGVDPSTTLVTVSENGNDLCGNIIPFGGGWECPLPGFAVAPGSYTIDVTAFDMYGTGTTSSVVIDAWSDPDIVWPPPGTLTSAGTIDIIGNAEVDAHMLVAIDGSTLPPGCEYDTPTAFYTCTTGLLGLGFHTIDVSYEDPNGTPSTVVNSDITIVPTLAAPTFITPTLGYESANRSVHVSMTNAPEGTVYVREGLFNLCPPTPIAVGTFSCTTSQLSVGTHTITISQTDQYGVMSASAQRTVTILPTPGLPLSMKTFGFGFSILDQNGVEIGDEGVGTGDVVTIVASGVPPGTLVRTEIHSDPVALGGMTVGQTGLLKLTSTVPAVPPGQHEIVVGATAPGYWPASFSAPLVVRGLKQIPGTDESPIKELGDPSDEKEPAEPDDATAGGPSGGTGGHGFEDPSVFGSSVETPFADHSFVLSPAGLVLSGSIAVAFLLLVGFPAELLESTIRSNYDRAFGWLARLRRRVGRMLAPVARTLSRPWVGSAITIAAAAFLLGFADPDFGVNGASVRLMLAMVIAVLAINVGLSLVVMRVAGRAFDVAAVLKPMPAALLIVGLSVLVSRLAGISPGFLFGVVLGVAYARELRLRDEARLGVLGVGLTIAAGLLAWLGYGIVSATASGPGFVNNLVIEILAAITLEALGTLVVALLPIEFLDGRTIFRWSKLAWAGLYAVTLLVFVFVVVPLSDNWGTMSAPIFGWGTLFAVFAVVAIVTWAIFRRKATPSSPAAAAPRRRVRR